MSTQIFTSPCVVPSTNIIEDILLEDGEEILEDGNMTIYKTIKVPCIVPSTNIIEDILLEDGEEILEDGLMNVDRGLAS